MQTYNSFNELATAQSVSPQVSDMSVFNFQGKIVQCDEPELALYYVIEADGRLLGSIDDSVTAARFAVALGFPTLDAYERSMVSSGDADADAVMLDDYGDEIEYEWQDEARSFLNTKCGLVFDIPDNAPFVKFKYK